MKKFIVLMMVLAIASVASAVGSLVITGSVNGENPTEVEHSEIVRIAIYEDGPNPGSLAVGSSITVTGPVDYVEDSYGNLAGAIDTMDLVDEGNVIRVGGPTAQLLLFPPQPVPGEELWFEFHVAGEPSDIIIIELTGLYGAQQDMSLWGTELHITPEPMTIALLGLGGLFLRRRK
jgi:hypothetical protein